MSGHLFCGAWLCWKDVVMPKMLPAGLAIRNVSRQLRPLRSAAIAIKGAEQTFSPAIPTEQQAILDAIGGGTLTH